MNMPFTVQQFLNVFAEYNSAIWPAQIPLYLLGIAMVVLAMRRVEWTGRFVTGALALYWIWMGALYHLVFFRGINPPAVGFGALFIAEGVLFALTAARGRLRFGAPQGWSGLLGALLILYALAVYPLIGMLTGHAYPRAPLFGAAPCPTTIFTFGILLWARGRVPVYLLVIPFLWSLVGFTAALGLGVPEDYGLFVAGLVGTGLLLARGRRKVAVGEKRQRTRISPVWWPLLAVFSPIWAALLAARNHRFRKNRMEAEQRNGRRLAAAQPRDLPELEFLELTVLVEERTEEGFLGDAGVSYLFRSDRGSLLFDVGFGPERPALGCNAARLGVTLPGIDALAISHLHLDHMGGLAAARAGKIRVSTELGSSHGQRCYLPAAASAEGFEGEVVEEPRILSAGMGTTGPLAKSLFFLGMTEEQALVARLKGKGLVVFTGCGHPGIELIIEMVRRLSDERVYAIGGGLHFPIRDGRGNRGGIQLQRILGTGKPPWRKITDHDLDATIDALNTIGPEKVYLSAHDSCDHALERLERELTAETRLLKAGATYLI